MALSDNKLKIQELIDTINALPGAGGGGGGLPAGISKLATGSFTPTFNMDGAYGPLQIWHNMGVTPNYIFAYDTLDYSETHEVSAFLYATLHGKRYKDIDCEVMYYPGWTSACYTSEGYAYLYNSGLSWENGIGSEFDINESYFNLYPSEGLDYGWFKEGHTYRWIAAVLDGFN